MHYYEFNYIEANTRTKNGTCKQISKCARYIDDIILFNCGNTFDNVKADIYPEELILNKENESYKMASFLDIQIHVKDNIFETKLYDKRTDFQFHIINFPFLCGNIPKKQSYGVFTSQLIRYSRVCSKYKDFVEVCRVLVRRLLNQGYKTYALRQYFNKLSIEFLNYNKPRCIIMTDIFNGV